MTTPVALAAATTKAGAADRQARTEPEPIAQAKAKRKAAMKIAAFPAQWQP